MNFKKAVKATPHLQNAWMPGLGALRAQDRPHISAEDTRKLTGSADVDGALRAHQPNAHRWDFAIAYRHSNRQQDCVYWVEMHTAIDKEVKVVLAKLHWLQTWLAADGKLLTQFECDFVWVSSGATSFTSTAPKVKLIAQHGLQYKAKVLRIPSVRRS